MTGAPYILVTGGRDYTDKQTILRWLGRVERLVWPHHPTLVHGDARGADRTAAELASVMVWRTEAWPADWNRLGKAAGAIRNQQMVEAHRYVLCVAFPGGRGTADMVRRCQRAQIPIVGPEHPMPVPELIVRAIATAAVTCYRSHRRHCGAEGALEDALRGLVAQAADDVWGLL